MADGHMARFNVRSLGIVRELRFLGAPQGLFMGKGSDLM